LFLASVGLYGVLSFSVNQRRHELGLRVALGASPGTVVRLVLGQAGFQLALGMALGIGLALVLVRAISFVLYGVDAAEWEVFVGVASLLAATTLVASFVPARRATRVDPMVAMQAE
jgi:putative ABC transport system permease protein